jgi:hypothetical protein
MLGIDAPEITGAEAARPGWRGLRDAVIAAESKAAAAMVRPAAVVADAARH